MIYCVKYNIEKNEFYTVSVNVHKEWGINLEPFWIDDENIFVCFEAKSLEEAKYTAANKIRKYFDGKKVEALREAAKYTMEVSKYEKLEGGVKYAVFVSKVGKYNVGDAVSVANDGQFYPTFWKVMGELTQNAWDNGYLGPFSLGHSPKIYPSNTVFRVIGKVEANPDLKIDRPLYLIAEDDAAMKMRNRAVNSDCVEGYEVFVCNDDGIMPAR